MVSETFKQVNVENCLGYQWVMSKIILLEKFDENIYFRIFPSSKSAVLEEKHFKYTYVYTAEVRGQQSGVYQDFNHQ